MSIIEKAVDKLSSEKPKDTRPVKSDFRAAEVDNSQAETPTQEVAKRPEPVAETTELFENEGSTRPTRKPDNPVVEPDDVAISFSELQLDGILALEGGRSKADEEYRMIKRPLLLRAFTGSNSPGRFPNAVMITSALSGEGKTFTSMNLAISMAMEINTTVLLVDSDLAKPNLSRQLGINEYPGFTECLKDETLDIGQFLLKTDVPSLTVLPAGQRHIRATELLASNSMQARLHELASRYSDRVILFDSPPLLATSEATALARHMGQVAVVVEYGSTPQFLVKEALNLLQSQESVSLILNKTRDDFLSRHVGGYSYGYGKGYGYGAYGER